MTNTNSKFRHLCPDWDHLEISYGDPEFESCTCYGLGEDTLESDIIYAAEFKKALESVKAKSIVLIPDEIETSEQFIEWIHSDKEIKAEQPYLEETVIYHKYNPNYGDKRVCECGHDYYRHFDTYDNMEPCGCKYCSCDRFVEEVK